MTKALRNVNKDNDALENRAQCNGGCVAARATSVTAVRRRDTTCGWTTEAFFAEMERERESKGQKHPALGSWKDVRERDSKNGRG
jgi:hypothetical protein